MAADGKLEIFSDCRDGLEFVSNGKILCFNLQFCKAARQLNLPTSVNSHFDVSENT